MDQPPTLAFAGDEDRTTQGRRLRVFSRARNASSDVVVDLTDLVFADASLIIDLAMLARRLRLRGRRLLLRQPQPQIRKLIELAGLHRLPSIELVPAPA